MDAIFKKLNYKNHEKIFVYQHPDSFNENLKSIATTSDIRTTIRKTDQIEFFIGFVTKKAEIDKIIPKVAPLLKDDAILWMVYPKGTSKNYQADFNRDNGWTIMKDYDLHGVRMVAIDKDWSALRFRKREYIKKMTRKNI